MAEAQPAGRHANFPFWRVPAARRQRFTMPRSEAEPLMGSAQPAAQPSKVGDTSVSIPPTHPQRPASIGYFMQQAFHHHPARPHRHHPPLISAPQVAPAMLGNMFEFYELGIYATVTAEISENYFGSTHEIAVWVGFSASYIARPFGAGTRIAPPSAPLRPLTRAAPFARSILRLDRRLVL